MRTYKLKPSSAQVNEGDTLTTTLETTDVITGTTLYYRVVGKGINAKDFSRGALKGTLTVGADGKATLIHSLKADKATEGSESFTIQVFSDKKMKNLVGTGDDVTIADTSVKAVKGGAKSSVNSGTAQSSSSSASFRDPLSGTQIRSDVIYGPESPVSKVFGSHVDSSFEFELSKSQIAMTRSGKVYSSQSAGRVVLQGEFLYPRSGELSGRLDAFSLSNFYPENFPSGRYEEVEVYTLMSPRTFKGSQEFIDLIKEVNPEGGLTPPRRAFSYHANADQIQIENMARQGVFLSPDKTALSLFGLSNFYSGEWWTSPFASNLI